MDKAEYYESLDRLSEELTRGRKPSEDMALELAWHLKTGYDLGYRPTRADTPSFMKLYDGYLFETGTTPEEQIARTVKLFSFLWDIRDDAPKLAESLNTVLEDQDMCVVLKELEVMGEVDADYLMVALTKDIKEVRQILRQLKRAKFVFMRKEKNTNRYRLSIRYRLALEELKKSKWAKLNEKKFTQ